MILMALDHIREFVHTTDVRPEDVTRATAALFFTRWITHFCAPVFMFYAGTSAFLWARNKNRSELSRFLAIRGLWLIVLEFTLARFALYFNWDYRLVILSILWALGCSMIALAALVHLPPGALVAVGAGMIAFHNMLDPVSAANFGAWGWVWQVVHQPGFVGEGRSVLVAYPLVPWIGVMACGYALGRVFLLEPERRRGVLLRLGAGLTIAFTALRAWNVYGDPSRWSHQASTLHTFLSFLNCTKYPPSLLFLLMTIGPALMATAWFERVRLSPGHPLVVFGRTPLFYFVVHLAVIHLIAAILLWAGWGQTNLFFHPVPSLGDPGAGFPAGYGYPLWVCYAVWAVVLAILYLPCRWYAGLKQRRRDWWLSYL